MGLVNNLKAKLGPAKGKVSGLAREHGDKIDRGLDKMAKTVDQKTKGKYSDRIQSGTGKAKDAMDRLAHKDDRSGDQGGEGTPGTTTPGSPPPAS
ncbi:antitoxin [Streptomyces poriticola]|uniref:antitoxin n=1 Tax=Streptomyces poriticola TaxID=3120506 RepID=UPI002FCE45AA